MTIQHHFWSTNLFSRWMKIIATDWKSRFRAINDPHRSEASSGRSTLQGMRGNCKFPVGEILRGMGSNPLYLSLYRSISRPSTIALASGNIRFRCAASSLLFHYSIAITRRRLTRDYPFSFSFACKLNITFVELHRFTHFDIIMRIITVSVIYRISLKKIFRILLILINSDLKLGH